MPARLAGWVGLADPDELVRAARGDVREVGRRAPAQAMAGSGPDPRDPAVRYEREVLKVVLQAPSLATGFDELRRLGLHGAALCPVMPQWSSAGGSRRRARAAREWVAKVDAASADDAVRRLVRELAVEPLPSDDHALTRYATEVLARLEELAATRRIAELKSRLQRLNPVERVPSTTACSVNLSRSRRIDARCVNGRSERCDDHHADASHGTVDPLPIGCG